MQIRISRTYRSLAEISPWFLYLDSRHSALFITAKKLASALCHAFSKLTARLNATIPVCCHITGDISELTIVNVNVR